MASTTTTTTRATATTALSSDCSIASDALQHLKLSRSSCCNVSSGIICNAAGTRIIALNVTGNGIVSPLIARLTSLRNLTLTANESLDINSAVESIIPPEFGNLTNLVHLELTGQKLTGMIPIQIGNLRNLTTLILRMNNLNSGVPLQIWNLPHLRVLDLSSNILSGLLFPSGINSSTLEYIDLSYNELSAQSPTLLTATYLNGTIPPEISNFRKLERINFFGTNLEGVLTPAIGEDGLRHSELGASNLVGPIPASLGNITTLTSLGIIPMELGNLQSLEILDLSSNQNLTGAIPDGIGNLRNLRQLSLQLNSLSGNIPVTFENLVNLTILGLQGNPIFGFIPPQLGRLSRLEKLTMSDCDLTGPIPEELGQLTNLTTLELQNNRLEGQIPSTFGNLSKATIINLSDNQLTSFTALPYLPQLSILLLGRNQMMGQLPPLHLPNLITFDISDNKLNGGIPEFMDMMSLETLNLARNNLTGFIPHHLQNLTSLIDFYLARNNLNGTLPGSLARSRSLNIIDVRSNQLSGHIPKEFNESTSLEVVLADGNYFSGTVPEWIETEEWGVGKRSSDISNNCFQQDDFTDLSMYNKTTQKPDSSCTLFQPSPLYPTTTSPNVLPITLSVVLSLLLLASLSIAYIIHKRRPHPTIPNAAGGASEITVKDHLVAAAGKRVDELGTSTVFEKDGSSAAIIEDEPSDSYVTPLKDTLETVGRCEQGSGWLLNSHEDRRISMDERPVKRVSQWTCDDVLEWLRISGFVPSVIQTFKTHEIDGYQLLMLSEQQMEDMGVVTGTTRGMVMFAVERLRFLQRPVSDGRLSLSSRAV
ncbi:hypothetical protein BC829DRAFT_384722 [Chytridium lagenaria]|nr:hypothetical protein BC829DRAFT_384722 [Chytridium lagenaria]